MVWEDDPTDPDATEPFGMTLNMSRREFFGKAAVALTGAFGIHFFQYNFWDRIAFRLGLRKQLRFKPVYILVGDELNFTFRAIEIEIYKGMTVGKLSEIYTGSVGNWETIMRYNVSLWMRIKPGQVPKEELNEAARKLKIGQSLYIPADLLAQHVKDIIDYAGRGTLGRRGSWLGDLTVERGGETETLWSIAVNLLDISYYNGLQNTIHMIYLLNPEIEVRFKGNQIIYLVYPGQRIVVPKHLLLEGMDEGEEEEEKVKEEVKEEKEDSGIAPEEIIKEEEKKEEPKRTPSRVFTFHGKHPKDMDDDELFQYYTSYLPPINKSKQGIIDRLNSKDDGKRLNRRRDDYNARRVHSGVVKRHNALDVRCPIGTNLYPMAVGTVIFAGEDKERWRNGNKVTVRTRRGFIISYIHMTVVSVSVGDLVGFGTKLGTSGNTGNASGRGIPEHVHIHAYLNGKKFDPEKLLAKDANFRAIFRSGGEKKKKEFMAHFKNIAKVDQSVNSERLA